MTKTASNLILLLVVVFGVAPVCAAPAETVSTPFSTTLKVGVPGRDPLSKSTLNLIGQCLPCTTSNTNFSDPNASCATDKCAQLTTTEEVATWDDGFEIAGQKVKQSVWVGNGLYVEGGMIATGLEWSILENGDTYVASWDEIYTAGGFPGFTGTWTLVHGTGTLEGITGQAELECAFPGPNEPLETCSIKGSYTLAK